MKASGNPDNRKRSGMRLPTRRVLAIDAGSRRVKVLLMHSDFGRLRLLRHEMVDLRAEGLVSAEEMKAHLHALIRELGHPPLTLIIPEHLSASHVIDLPPGPESEVKKQIGDEAIKLSGVSESKIIYDFARLEATGVDRQQFWVTLCHEENIRSQVIQLGIEHEDICEVTTTANALITAHRMASPSASRALLFHVGAQTTVLAGVHNGQGAFASSIQMGGDFFTRTIARARNISEEEAEALKRSENLFKGPNACPELVEAVNGWAAEIQRQLKDALRQNPTLWRDGASVELVWSGGGFDQPGLLEQLAATGLRLRPWPEDTIVDGVSCPPGFEVAFGAALEGLGYSSQPISLLPEDYRAGWQRRVGRQRLELASLFLAMLVAILLGIGTWRKLTLIHEKEALRAKVHASQEFVQSNEALTTELLTQYRALQPIFAGQQNTRDILKTLGLLQQVRTNQNFWFLLVADQQTYFSIPPLEGAASSNRAAKASIGLDWLEPVRAAALTNRVASTNVSPARPGLIAELCIPGDSESVRRTLQKLVGALKQSTLFSQADLLSEDLRRNLADPRLVVPDRYFVLALNFSESELQQPVAVPKKSPALINGTKRPRAARLEDSTLEAP